MTDNRAPSGARLAIVELLRRSGAMTAGDISVALAHTHGIRLRVVRNCLAVLGHLNIVVREVGDSDTTYVSTGRRPALYSLREQTNA